MAFALRCPRCCREFFLFWDSPMAAVLERVAGEGPWSAVGDGATWEDHVSSALATEAATRCPECGGQAVASEETLNQFTQEVLGQW